MKRKRFRPSYSLEHYIRVLIRLSIPIIVINVIVSLFFIVSTRKQNITHISNAVTIYQKEMVRKTFAVEHFVRWTAIHEPLLEKIESGPFGDRLEAIKTFRTRVSDNQYATGKEYQYFLYLKDQNLFLNASSLNFGYSDYLLCKKALLKRIESGETKKNSNDWKILKLGKNYYFCYSITYKNRTFISLISAKDILAPLNEVNLGPNGFMLMEDLNNTILAKTEPKKVRNTSNNMLLSRLDYGNEESNLPFNLSIYIDNWFYERIIIIQVFIIIMAFILALTLFVFLFYMKRKVIKPIQNFSLSLSKINEGSSLLDLQDGNIIELEQASLQFRNLMREITKLKINLYEEELEKKRIQIGYLQQQIKPHFYLNCLTTIYSMAQTKNYKEIESMALFTSEYLRYLFQSNKDFIKLEYELNHVNDYLSIQKLRYGSAISYQCNVQAGTAEAVIPPLLLMTFIENAIKHCVSLTVTLQITLTIKKQKKDEADYLRIIIQDNGPGFNEDILNVLNNHQALASEGGSRVGIRNTIERLSFLYGNEYELNFSNNADKGACIELLLPFNTESK